VLDLALDAPPRDWSVALREWEQSLEQPPAAGTEPADADATPEGPSLPLSAYAGSYLNPLLGRAVLVESPDGLHLALPDHGGLDGPLAQAAGEAFECRWSDPSFGTSTVEFDLEQGRAIRLRFQVRPDFIDPLVYEFTRADDDGGRGRAPGRPRARPAQPLRIRPGCNTA
jgi:hypothetical protein